MYHNGLKTASFWSIANIGILVSILGMLLILVRHLIWTSSISDAQFTTLLQLNGEGPEIDPARLLEFKWAIRALPLLLLFIFAILMGPVQKWGHRIGRYLCLLLLCLLYPIGRHILSTEWVSIPGEQILLLKTLSSRTSFVLIVATLLAVPLAVTTWCNFDEVVSRRMLYRNSSAAMFEIQWGYTLAIFFDAAVAIATFMLAWMAQSVVYKVLAFSPEIYGLPIDVYLSPNVWGDEILSFIEKKEVYQSIFH